jgi:hypothetical protein
LICCLLVVCSFGVLLLLPSPSLLLLPCSDLLGVAAALIRRLRAGAPPLPAEAAAECTLLDLLGVLLELPGLTLPAAILLPFEDPLRSRMLLKVPEAPSSAAAAAVVVAAWAELPLLLLLLLLADR